MNRSRASGARGAARALVIAMILPVAAPAAESDERRFQATTQDTAGTSIKIPRKDRATLLLFLRAGQDQSVRTIETARAAMRGAPPAQVLVVLSGAGKSQETGGLAKKIPWSVAIDKDFRLFAKFQVRVWPTTLVILPDGRELARLSGLPRSYARDVNAYLSFAAGKIDRAALTKALSRASTVTDTPHQMAKRHLLAANRLLERGRVKLAQQEVTSGLKLLPKDPSLVLAKARILLLLDGPREALSLLESMGEDAALAGKVNFLKGWALVAMRRWDLAIQTLRVAVRLNPDRAESYYLLGVAYQRKGLATDALKAFRAAFESTAGGQRLSSSLRAREVAKRSSTTQPAKQPK